MVDFSPAQSRGNMRLLEPYSDSDQYEFLVADAKAWEHDLLTFDGTARARNWTPLQVSVQEYHPRHKRRKLLPTDLPYLGPGFLVATGRAIETLRDLIAAHCEFLPLRTSGQDYYVCNVTTVIDGLDREMSRFQQLDTGQLYEVRRLVLRASAIDSIPIFKEKTLRRSRVFVTDEFASRVIAGELHGIQFREHEVSQA